MEIKIAIKNLPQVQAALAKSPQIVSKYINKAINKSILDIRNSAIPKTPVDTGRLRGSYNMTFGNLRGVLQPKTKYAYWVEVLPYKHTTGQSHYLESGVKESNSKVNQNFNTGLKNALSEVARSAGGH